MKKELNEDNLPSNVLVKYKGKKYVTGNIYRNLVELYIGDYGYGTGGDFYKVVCTDDVIVLEPHKIL